MDQSWVSNGEAGVGVETTTVGYVFGGDASAASLARPVLVDAAPGRPFIKPA